MSSNATQKLIDATIDNEDILSQIWARKVGQIANGKLVLTQNFLGFFRTGLLNASSEIRKYPAKSIIGLKSRTLLPTLLTVEFNQGNDRTDYFHVRFDDAQKFIARHNM